VSGPGLNALWARTLVGELVRGGVREAVVCPGSRSTPLALACADEPGLTVRSVIDERSAAFFALGAAKASGRPALVLATSGSAGAHFFPALLEAEASGVPLIAITADRPPELHGWGAPQTMDQQQLFGGHVRLFADLGVPEETPLSLRHLAATAALAIARATRAPRGPVHLNAPFREPLAPPAGTQAEAGAAKPAPAAGRIGLFAQATGAIDVAAVEQVARELSRRPRGLIVCGPRDRREEDAVLRPAVAALSAALGYPVLAEATSGLREGGLAITSYDSLLRHQQFAEAACPQAVIRLGGGLTSKLLQGWLDASGAWTVQLAEGGALHDPAHVASAIVEGPAALWCAGLAARARSQSGAPGPLLRLFTAGEARAQAALEQAFAGSDELSEPRVAREVAAALPPESLLFSGSSMPIRDLDAFAPASARARMLSSRGLNGIDGSLSTALGAAAATGLPTVALLGDLTLLHDLGGLVTARRLGVPLTIVCVNNDGGGIFSFLPVAQAISPGRFEALFGTPHGVDLSAAAALAGARYLQPATPAALREAITGSLGHGLHLIEVRTSRVDNVAAHRALQQAVCDALGGGPWP
jgi:2-succinyl-5-enolpyruvyl-6-hydroxy-3-cyclohexene-1-carboxylate synthase